MTIEEQIKLVEWIRTNAYDTGDKWLYQEDDETYTTKELIEIYKKMTLTKAIKILKKHQKWRLGAETKPTEPKKLTEAINVILYYYDTTRKNILH
jgi:hypothetical protein